MTRRQAVAVLVGLLSMGAGAMALEDRGQAPARGRLRALAADEPFAREAWTVRDLYARLLRYDYAARQMRAAETAAEVPATGYLAVTVRQIRTSETGGPSSAGSSVGAAIHLERRTWCHLQDPCHVAYDVAWADAVEPALQSPAATGLVVRVTTYAVTLTLDGRSREYTGQVRYHAAQDGAGLVPEVVDPVIPGLQALVDDREPLAVAPWDRYVRTARYQAVAQLVKGRKTTQRAAAGPPIGFLAGDDVDDAVRRGELVMALSGDPCEPSSLSVDQADITQDKVVVSISPSSVSGRLLVVARRDDGGTQTLLDDTRSGGSYNIGFQAASLAVGQYVAVDATWSPSQGSANGSRGVAFRVLGVYRHSRYNTPYESQCSGGSQFVYITDNLCNFNDGSLRSLFVSQVNLNGSGVSIAYGPVQRERFCGRPRREPPPDWNGISFRPVTSINPTCTGLGLGDSTVARVAGHPYLTCGDQVLIVGPWLTKTVTDECPGCSQSQLDNYTTQQACSPHDIGDLGSYQTIRLR